jgi:hypothetical protein
MAQPIPPRTQDALSGAQILSRLHDILGDTQHCSNTEMEARRARVEEFVFQQVCAGNVPSFMRPENWPEMSVEMSSGGRTVTARVRVCPDYLSIGGDSDPVRVPINPLTAQRIADRFGFSLPTQRLVDLIDAQAASAGGMASFVAAPSIAKRVTDPSTGNPVEKNWHYQQYGFYEGRWMLSAEFIGMQNQIYSELPESVRTARIRSGFKKDVIYDELAFHESHEGGPPVIIYRKGVQGLSNWHNEKYWDYSHGIRFLSDTVSITVRERDGTTHDETMSMRDVLRSREYHRLFTPAPLDITNMYRGSARVVPRKTGRLEEPARGEPERLERARMA